MAGEGDALLSAAKVGGTFKDLADRARLVEDVVELLEVDPLRWDPLTTQSRMEKISNALSILWTRLGELEVIKGNADRKSQEYRDAQNEVHVVEAKIDTLKKRWETLKNRCYIKADEWRVTR